MIKTINITGLDCASCAAELEQLILKINGVDSASVDFISQKVRVECADEVLPDVINCCNDFEDVKVLQENCCERAGAYCKDKKLKIKNLCCANCARELEEILNKTEGIDATVDFINLTVTLTAQNEQSYAAAIDKINHFEDVKIVDSDSQKYVCVARRYLKEILTIAISVIFFIPAICLLELGGYYGRIISYPLFAVSYLSVAYEVLWNTAKNIAKGHIFDENFLMTIASLGAIALGIFWGDGIYEGVAVMVLYQTGELLQSIAVGSSRKSITDLMALKSQSATLLRDGVQKVVPPEELEEGDIILIKAGEKVPVDGIVCEGESSLDMSPLNGEAMPLDVNEGDEILSGAINISKALKVKVIRKFCDSAVAKILDLVENSTAKKSKSEKFITKFARYYTPVVCFAAVLVAAAVPTIICAVNGAYTWGNYAQWIYRALSFLVISCPCALVISVPLSYFGGIGRCAKSGILVKGSDCIDRLAAAKVAAFDKTGTLTEGAFRIKSYSSRRALALAASAERYSSHPIAAAFKDIIAEYEVSRAEEIAGRGVKCFCDGNKVLCGNEKFMNENGIAFERAESVFTVIYVAENGEYAGFIEIGDAIKEGAVRAVSALRDEGVEYCGMLTGDNRARAEFVAEKTGLDGFNAGLMPDDKLRIAEELKSRGNLLYVGDGINDAPVMAAADCAVSMGKVGSDAAIEASDVVLLSDNLELLPKGIRIAKGTRRIVFQNIIGSLAIKLAIMALGIALPVFPLIVAVVADVGVMLVAVLNSMRTKLIK